VEIYERVLNEILPPPEADGADVHRLARLQCLNNLAYILAKELGKPEQALPYAERAAEMRPNDADVLDTYGLVLLRLDRLEDADRELSKSLAVEEKTPNLLHMAEVKMKLGLLEEARTYLNKAQVKIAPHEADYQEYMQRLRQELLDLEAGN
jgi:tetratricopeptide (TPR) repeat protein